MTLPFLLPSYRGCTAVAGIAAFMGLSAPFAAAENAADPIKLGQSESTVRAFWQETRTKLAREPMEAAVEQLKEPLPYRKFRITLRGLGGVHFRALLGLPVQDQSMAKPWPAIVTVPGYGGTQQGAMLSECMRGYAVLQVYPRSQGESARGMMPTSHRAIA